MPVHRAGRGAVRRDVEAAGPRAQRVRLPGRHRVGYRARHRAYAVRAQGFAARFQLHRRRRRRRARDGSYKRQLQTAGAPGPGVQRARARGRRGARAAFRTRGGGRSRYGGRM